MRRGVLCMLCALDTVMQFHGLRKFTAKSCAKKLCKTELSGTAGTRDAAGAGGVVMATVREVLDEMETDVSCIGVVGDALSAASEAHGYSQRECERLALLMDRLLDVMRARVAQLRSAV